MPVISSTFVGLTSVKLHLSSSCEMRLALCGVCPAAPRPEQRRSSFERSLAATRHAQTSIGSVSPAENCFPGRGRKETALDGQRSNEAEEAAAAWSSKPVTRFASRQMPRRGMRASKRHLSSDISGGCGERPASELACASTGVLSHSECASIRLTASSPSSPHRCSPRKPSRHPFTKAPPSPPHAFATSQTSSPPSAIMFERNEEQTRVPKISLRILDSKNLVKIQNSNVMIQTQR